MKLKIYASERFHAKRLPLYLEEYIDMLEGIVNCYLKPYTEYKDLPNEIKSIISEENWNKCFIQNNEKDPDED